MLEFVEFVEKIQKKKSSIQDIKKGKIAKIPGSNNYILLNNHVILTEVLKRNLRNVEASWIYRKTRSQMEL
jgi:hypothetical protein